MHYRGGSQHRQRESGHEFGQVGVAFEAMEAEFDVQQGGGGPAGELVGLQPPPGDLGGLAAIVPHDVLDRVGREQRAVQGGRDIELVQGDKRLAGLIEAGGGGGVERQQEGPQLRERFAAGHFASGQAQPLPQACGLRVVTFAQVAVEIALLVLHFWRILLRCEDSHRFPSQK